MSKHVFYRGDTFKLAATVSAMINGQRTRDLTGYVMSSQIRDPKGGLIATLTCEWIDAAQGIAQVSAPGSTVNWPLTTAKMNFRFTKDGNVVSSPSAFFSIEEPPTK